MESDESVPLLSVGAQGLSPAECTGTINSWKWNEGKFNDIYLDILSRIGSQSFGSFEDFDPFSFGVFSMSTILPRFA